MPVCFPKGHKTSFWTFLSVNLRHRVGQLFMAVYTSSVCCNLFNKVWKALEDVLYKKWVAEVRKEPSFYLSKLFGWAKRGFLELPFSFWWNTFFFFSISALHFPSCHRVALLHFCHRCSPPDDKTVPSLLTRIWLRGLMGMEMMTDAGRSSHHNNYHKWLVMGGNITVWLTLCTKTVGLGLSTEIQEY